MNIKCGCQSEYDCNCTEIHITYKGWDHGNGGQWQCTLAIPQGWSQVKDGETLSGDKCMMPEVPEKTLKHGDIPNKIDGRWEPVEADNVGRCVGDFRAIIRES